MVKRDLNRCARKYTEEAEKVGLTYLGAGDSSHPTSYRKYRINSCLHELNLLPSNVRNKTYRCRDCLNIKLKLEAEQQGLELLTQNKSKIQSYLLPCGHSQTLYTSAIRTGEWICRTCAESYYNNPSSLYLVKIKSGGFEWLKLGFTNNKVTRFLRYKIEEPEFDILYEFQVLTGKDAIQIEKRIHHSHRKFRLLPLVMKIFHEGDGFTECYPVKLESSIIQQMKLEEAQYNLRT